MLADVFVLCIAFRLCPEQKASVFPFPFFIAKKKNGNNKNVRST